MMSDMIRQEIAILDKTGQGNTRPDTTIQDNTIPSNMVHDQIIQDNINTIYENLWQYRAIQDTPTQRNTT